MCLCVSGSGYRLAPIYFFQNTCHVCACVCVCVCVCVRVLLSSYLSTHLSHVSIFEHVCLHACMCLHLLSACVCVFCCWKIYTAVSHLHRSSLVLSQSAMLLKTRRTHSTSQFYCTECSPAICLCDAIIRLCFNIENKVKQNSQTKFVCKTKEKKSTCYSLDISYFI